MRNASTRLLSIAAVTAALAVGFAVPSATALSAAPSLVGTKKVTACVNKKTGQMRYISGGKCQRGEKKVTWNSEGPTGPAGPAGPAGAAGAAGQAGAPGLSVVTKDGNSNVVAGVIGTGTWGIDRLVDGGIFSFQLNGQLSWAPPSNLAFRTAGCTGTAYQRQWVDNYQPEAIPGGSQARLVIRGADNLTKTVYSYTGNTVPLPTGDTYYGWSPDNWNAAAPNWTCTLITATEDYSLNELAVAGSAPANLVGPLTFSIS